MICKVYFRQLLPTLMLAWDYFFHLICNRQQKNGIEKIHIIIIAHYMYSGTIKN